MVINDFRARSDLHHDTIRQANSLDFYLYCTPSMLLACHYGSIQFAHEAAERHATAVRTLLLDPDMKSDVLSVGMMCCVAPIQYYFIGRGAAVSELCRECGVTYQNAETSLLVIEENADFCRKLGETKTEDNQFACTEFFVWTARFGLLLCTDCSDMSPADVFEELPTVEQLTDWVNMPTGPTMGSFASIHMLEALVCDMLSTKEPRLQQRCDIVGLELCRAVASEHAATGGDSKPTARIIARMMEARFLARMGRVGEANVASEAAVALALALELWLLAALALRDLRGRARGHSQRSEYERRMCACVRDLDDEPALISDVLNKCFVWSTPDAPGLDVAQLLAV
jgi:hypothetical protein